MVLPAWTELACGQALAGAVASTEAGASVLWWMAGSMVARELEGAKQVCRQHES